MTSGRRWISPRECAEYIGLHIQSVYSMIARGEIPACRVGRAVRVDLKALEQRLESQITGQASGGRR